MERQLKHHEQKLLKKANFVEWKKEHNLREIQIIRRYRIQDREDYSKYNKLCMQIKKLAHQLQAMEVEDPIRNEMVDQLLDKLYEDFSKVNCPMAFFALQKATLYAQHSSKV